jgi:hypothetical protein
MPNNVKPWTLLFMVQIWLDDVEFSIWPTDPSSAAATRRFFSKGNVSTYVPLNMVSFQRRTHHLALLLAWLVCVVAVCWTVVSKSLTSVTVR